MPSIIIPNSVTNIGDFAFWNSTSLTSITIPQSVTSIGNKVLNGCSGLTSIIVETGNAIYDSRNGCNAIIETATNTLIYGCQTTVIPSTVMSISDYAFYKCSGLTSINIPNSVTSIGSAAFCDCSSLTSVTIPNRVTTIEYAVFSGCSSLTFVSIPNSVTYLGNSAFSGCSSLTSVTIPNSVTSIGREAFSHCSSLTNVYCLAENVPNTSSYVFYSSPISEATLHVPESSLEIYKVTTPWSEFGNIVALPEVWGDLNDDNKIDIADAVSILNLMAEGDNNPLADLNGDNKVDIADFVTVLNIMAQQ